MTGVSDMIELGRKQTELFIKNNLCYCELLINGNSNRHIMSMIYETLVRQGKITAIEKLSAEEKIMSWDTAKDMSKGRLDKGRLIEFVKCLHVIEYFL